MFISQPNSLTEMYVDVVSIENKYENLLNANFQDYMDSLKQSGELQIKSGSLKHKVSGLFSGAGMAAGALGGPAGLSIGYAVGNTVGKYVGNVVSNRVYGQAMTDMSEIYHVAKLRHTQLATSFAIQRKMGEAVDTLRQNENKRIKDALQAMSS